MIHINNRYEEIVFYDKDRKRNRKKFPAYIEGNYQVWYENNKLHRLDGPAVIDGNYEEWHIAGVRYELFEYNNKIKQMRL